MRNPPTPPFFKGGDFVPPLSKGGRRGIFKVKRTGLLGPSSYLPGFR